MKKFHIAIAVKDLNESISEYSLKLECRPVRVIPEKYALWRTDNLNFSISQRPDIAGQIRHIGFEDSSASKFEITKDSNGIIWENFTENMQNYEIKEFYGE